MKHKSHLLVQAIWLLLHFWQFVYDRYDGASDLATAEFYNPLVNTWTAITPMGTKRSCLGKSLHFQDYNSYQFFEFVFLRHLRLWWSHIRLWRVRWSFLFEQHGKIWSINRSMVQLSCHEHQEKILSNICCGWDYLISTFQEISFLSSCLILCLDNCIYALGGFDSTNYQASVER